MCAQVLFLYAHALNVIYTILKLYFNDIPSTWDDHFMMKSI
jgi:hypothetical protein